MQGDDLEFVDITNEDVSYFIRAEHLARYVYLSEQFRKRKLKYALDIACGSGYGSKEIAKHVDKLIAVDKICRNPFTQYSNIEYVTCDLNSESYINNIQTEKKFDAISCLETLEHVDNPKTFLLQLSKVIRKGGLLGISVPNGEYEKLDTFGHPVNNFHLHSFTEDNLEKLLNLCKFKVIRKLYQPTSAQLYRNEARALRDLTLTKDYAKKMSPNVSDLGYFCRLYAWPNENKCQSYSLMFICERM